MGMIGLILLLALIIYEYNVRKDGNSSKKALLSCLYLFLIASFGVSLIFQVGSVFMLHSRKPSFLSNAILIIGIIYIISVPIIAYNKSWFGIAKKNKEN